MNSQNCIEEKQSAHHTCAYMLTDMDTDWKCWFSRYFVKSTFVLGSCTYTQYIIKVQTLGELHMRSTTNWAISMRLLCGLPPLLYIRAEG